MPSRAKSQRQLEAAALLRPAGRTPTTTTGHEMPADVVQKGVNRLGFLGLVCAVMAPGAFLAEYYIQPARVVLPGRVPLPAIAAAFLCVIGLLVCYLCWTRKLAPGLMLDLGLVFEAVGAFGIALSEYAGPLPPSEPIRGISWNCLWISVFVVAVPGTYRKVATAAVGSAFMGLAGFAVATAVNDNPMPTLNQLLILQLPVFAAAGWAIPVARYINRLVALVIKAREMGSYQLVELIGRGGMGEVWEAQHRYLRRRSAIKLIRSDVLTVEDGGKAESRIRRFEREAQATAALRSPHTVDLYDFGLSDDGRFYYVMELLDGLDLETLVRRYGPQAPARVIHILQQVLKSLAEAHDSGLIHRDIKPKNIFLCRLGNEYDFVKVLDFGLVKSVAPTAHPETQLTGEGIAAGTPACMAPEIAIGSEAVDARADLYSFGCVAYWLLTGQLVFERPTPMAMILAHVQTPPTPPSERTEVEIPESLERIILSCLEKDPARRPQTALELSRLLSDCPTSDLWTQDQAQCWWATHRPAVSAPGEDRDSTETNRPRPVIPLGE
jgi:serine/threonine protein kinase